LIPILTLGVPFLIILGSYYLLTLAYSFGLKRIVLIDVITLAGLYTLRIIAGATAIDVPLSFWLLLFSVFIFLSLALVKRYAELDNMRRASKIDAAGRGYNINDMPTLFSLGTTSGYLSVLVLALYINSTEVNSLYRHPQIIWLLCIIFLYWISRIWMITHKGDMHDDPVMFAIKDKISLGTGLLCALILSFAV
jgi:4-hydroxybenzoate polyprenyltransferase